MLGGLVGLGGHHELLAGQTRGSRGSPVIDGLKLESWERPQSDIKSSQAMRESEGQPSILTSLYFI